jgi:myo-inositol-1(or 4)-monophosphatase
MSDATMLHTFTPGSPDATARLVIARARRVLDDVLDMVRENLTPLAGRGEVTFKSDGTPVTVHDRATDELLAAAILAEFPDHGILSEERDRTAPATDWTWVIDPIDGTSNFIAGVPYWCVSVALCLSGAPVLGVVEAPPLARRFTATVGEGAWSSGSGGVRRLAVSGSVRLHDTASAHVPGLYSGGAARDLTSDGATLNARIMGAAALDLAFVAAGVAPLTVTLGPHVWDVAAGALLVTEAGGAVLGWGSEPLLPLFPGRDYARAVVRTAAATDPDGARLALEAVERGRTARREARDQP